MGAMDIYAESALDNTDLLPYGDDTYQIVDEALGGVIAYCHEGSADRIVGALIAARDAANFAPAPDLGSLIEVLAACNPAAEALVAYNGELAWPARHTYYRGFHDDLAISPDGPVRTTVGALLEILLDIRTNGFTRPGVETAAFDSTGVWVAKHREPSGLRVTGVRDEGSRVVIVTAS
jgi:hypothetical protein